MAKTPQYGAFRGRATKVLVVLALENDNFESCTQFKLIMNTTLEANKNTTWLLICKRQISLNSPNKPKNKRKKTLDNVIQDKLRLEQDGLAKLESHCIQVSWTRVNVTLNNNKTSIKRGSTQLLDQKELAAKHSLIVFLYSLCLKTQKKRKAESSLHWDGFKLNFQVCTIITWIKTRVFFFVKYNFYRDGVGQQTLLLYFRMIVAAQKLKENSLTNIHPWMCCYLSLPIYSLTISSTPNCAGHHHNTSPNQ